MTITRVIDGTPHEIELTSAEIYGAYVVQQFEFDRADIEDLVCGMSDADVMACYDVGIEQFKSLIDDMAYEMRRQIDKYDVSWEYARDEAVRSVIEEAGTNVRT